MCCSVSTDIAQYVIRFNIICKKFTFTFGNTLLHRHAIKYNIQLCTTSADLVRNIFLKQPFSTKSSELNCLLLIGHASRPYNSTGRHLTFNSSTVTFSEATPATFLNTALKAKLFGVRNTINMSHWPIRAFKFATPTLPETRTLFFFGSAS